jgi:hypothetical protein
MKVKSLFATAGIPKIIFAGRARTGPDGNKVRNATILSWLIGSLAPCGFEAPLVQQQSAQRAQIVQEPAARGHMTRELRQIEVHYLERLFTAISAIGASQCDVGFNIGEGLLDRLRKQGDVFMGTFDVVERSLGFTMTHLCDLLKCHIYAGVRRTQSVLQTLLVSHENGIGEVQNRIASCFLTPYPCCCD